MYTNQTLLSDLSIVAFDTETSGAYPVGYDIVEFGAIKYYQGREVATLQFLFKPREPMSDFIIGIHGISNEMVENCESISSKIQDIYNFFKDSVIVAHHAPFDLGFMVFDFERANLPMPSEAVLCSSLLSRKLIHETENHKLQTLVKHFGWDGGNAHRALDDARSCLQLTLECFKRLGPEATLEKAQKVQEKKLDWSSYSILYSSDGHLKTLAQACLGKKQVDMIYEKGGGGRNEVRQVLPIGLVRNPDSDFLHAHCMRDNIAKRFYLNKIKDVSIRF
ncbi:MAG: exonuclease domain-containing protein [Bdellovibrionia bacterium]